METNTTMSETTGMHTADRTVTVDRLIEEKASATREIRNDTDLTPEARNRTLNEATASYDEKITAAARSVLEKIDEEGERLERKMYRGSTKPLDQATELYLGRLRNEVTDELVAGSDPVRMYEDALRFGDKQRARLLERVAPPWLEDRDQRARFNALVAENEPSHIKNAREERDRLRDIRRNLELGFNLRGIRV